jgi:predicted nucleic acid-binding Zn ribbon protein
MPTYVYKFVETGETIEVLQAFTDDALTEAVHPSTGESMQVKKVFQPVGVTFRGGGFYKTDSRGGSSKSASTTPSTASADSGSSSTSTSSSSDNSSSGSSSSGSSSSGSSSSGNSSSSTSTSPAAAPAT